MILPLFFILRLSLPNYSHTLSLLLPKYHLGKHVFIVNYFLTFDKRFFLLKNSSQFFFSSFTEDFYSNLHIFYFVSTTFSPENTLVFMKKLPIFKKKIFFSDFIF